MTDARAWNRVKDLLYEALAIAPDEREAFLERSCGGDASLRAEVESLLAAHAAAADFGERSARPAPAGDGGAAVLAAPGSAIHAGHRVGPYEIQSHIGSGGMGDVYRARDARLGRDVAIKVLSPSITADRARVLRVEREARVLASLNHPHIAAIYGLEEHDGVPALVLELVDGITLAERLSRGPLPIGDALRIAEPLADALEAAHDQGIVHRDLKPANVKIARDGTVKVLDFGLAKILAPGADVSSQSAAADRTADGMLIGTAPYMSPEQARGEPVDIRTDIWAWGCIVYEMLVGRAPFPGVTIADHVAAILEKDPDWTALPRATPPSVRALLRRCLEKNVSRRLRDIGAARLEIEEVLEGATEERTWRRALPRRNAAVAVALIIAAAAIAVFARLITKPVTTARTDAASLARFAIVPPANAQLGFVYDSQVTALAVSPDGRYLAYTAGPRSQLYLRALDQFESTLVPGTDDADVPFFSPDGRWLGFVSDNKLKKVPLTGGSPMTLCSAFGTFGASWGADNTIVFASTPGNVLTGGPGGLLQVSSDGGEPKALTRLAAQEGRRRWPELLPDGRHVLFSAAPVGSRPTAEAMIYVQSLDTGTRSALVKGDAPHYVRTGHLVYARSGTVFAAPFDAARLAVVGDPVPLIEGIQQTDDSGPELAVSRTGTIAYARATPERPRRLVWVDRAGAEQPLDAPLGRYLQPRLAPDAGRLAVAVEAETQDLWVYSLARHTLTRLTSQGQNELALWTADGRRVAFAQGNLGLNGTMPPSVYWKTVDTGDAERPLIQSDRPSMPSSWSPDGRVLAYFTRDSSHEYSPEFTGLDIWWVSLDDLPHPHVFLKTKFNEAAPVFSPDGRWLAYVSNESGRNEIYVQPFPGPGERVQVSTDGGNELTWPRRGHELFYRSGNAIMAVDVDGRRTFSAGQPRRLFEGDFVKTSHFQPNYDVSADGQRFVMVRTVDDPMPPTPINVIVNWQEELKQRVPTR